MKFLVLFALALATTSVVPISATKGRISNGKKAAIGQFPYQVGLTFFQGGAYARTCSGSLIDNSWVVTSAVCTKLMDKVIVYLGGITLKTSEVYHIVNSTQFIVSSGNDKNNIALIKIPYTNFTDNIKKVNLPPISNINSSYRGFYGIASGWGRTSDSSSAFAIYLQWGRVGPVISNPDCVKTFGSSVTSSNICVATPGHVSACEGDFGGPLVLDNSNILIGVGSFKNGNCEGGEPVVYTRVNRFMEWISKNTGIKLM